jgi:hypothetical protein
MKAKKYAHKVLIGKPIEERPLGSTSCRCQDKKNGSKRNWMG